MFRGLFSYLIAISDTLKVIVNRTSTAYNGLHNIRSFPLLKQPRCDFFLFLRTLSFFHASLLTIFFVNFIVQSTLNLSYLTSMIANFENDNIYEASLYF